MSGAPFLDFFYALRRHGLGVTTHDWMALMDALAQGLHHNELGGFYKVARCTLCSSETAYDGFDRAFLETFEGVEVERDALLEELDAWLSDPARLMNLDPALAAALEEMDFDELRKRLLETLREQQKRHEGGSRWVGSGGTSPFGTGSFHPSGVRMGGGGGRSALAVADARRFSDYRNDRILDTRQMASALRRLRKLTRKGGALELDLDETVDQTARNCGDLEVVMRPPRKNDVRMLLLMDVGGSMDPHAELVGRLFSAAHRGAAFKELRSYYFHNCVYSSVYEDARFTRGVALEELFRTLDSSWYVVLVGDAWMHPGELMMTSSSFWNYQAGPSGLRCLARLADHFPHSAWINPESPKMWDAPTIREIGALFDMFPLTLRGLDDLVETIRRNPTPARRLRVQSLVREEAA